MPHNCRSTLNLWPIVVVIQVMNRRAIRTARIILGRLNYIASNNVQAVGQGALYYPMENGTKTETTSNNPLNYPVEIAIDASRSSSLYVNDLSEVRVNALFSMMLIRSY